MPKQSRFLCIGGFLNGSAVKDQGDSFVCVENGKQVTYRVCETATDKQARNWVYDIKPD